jgi:hypothetical protein
MIMTLNTPNSLPLAVETPSRSNSSRQRNSENLRSLETDTNASRSLLVTSAIDGVVIIARELAIT